MEDLLNFIQDKFNPEMQLLETIKAYFCILWKRYPDKVKMIEKSNISMLTLDELVIEWMMAKSYLQVRIKSSEIRCEAKFQDGTRFGKYHQIPAKMVDVVDQIINKMKEDNG